MSSPPKVYRLYCFDIERKEVTADFIKAASDTEAIAHAEACKATKCEIWDGKRLVARHDAGATST